MAIHHVPVQTPARTIVRDHREPVRSAPVVRPIERDHREQVRWERGRDDYRPRIVLERPIIGASVYTTAPSYTVIPQPIQLLAPTPLSSEQLSIDVGNLGGSTSLELDATGPGTTYVSQVVLVAPDGDTQVVPVNQILSAQNPCVQLPMSGGIARVIVDGHSDWGGQLALRAV
jgi:hypothetical protein